MESILKETAKKAPLPTLAVALFYTIISKVLDKEIDVWLLFIITISTFTLSFFLLYLKFNKKKNPEVEITDQEVEDVDTDGGDVLVGVASRDNESLIIKNNTIKKVNTGGGDFTVGSGRK